MNGGPEVFIEVRHSDGGCYVKATVEGASDQLPRTFVGACSSRVEAMSEATTWALGWLRMLREGLPRHCPRRLFPGEPAA
jgi:hypothetical protein